MQPMRRVVAPHRLPLRQPRMPVPGLQRMPIRTRIKRNRLRDLRKLGYLPPIRLARFNEILKKFYPKEIP